MTTGNKAEINVTPLIDVLLVLLIIFMVIIPHNSRGLEARVPQPPDEKTAPAPAPVVVKVRADRTVEINTQVVEWADLGERLKEIFALRAAGVLFVGGAGSVDYADVARVIDTARGVGINRVALLR